jgi:hypothetical protein
MKARLGIRGAASNGERRIRRWSILVGLLLACGGSLALPAISQAYVFWSNEFGSSPGNSLGRDTIDGSVANINQSFVGNGNDPKGVAIDGNFIYWANYGGNSIGRANLDGSNVNPNFITGAVDPEGVAVQGNNIYWANTNFPNPTVSSIGCDTIDGNPANVNQNMITGTDFPVGIALVGNTIFWANFESSTGAGSIGTATVNGCTATGVNQNFIPSGTSPPSPIGPAGVTSDGTFLYWANFSSTTIGRYTLGAAVSVASVNESFINTGTIVPLALAVDKSFIYWTNRDGTGAGAGTVGRDTLDGNAANIKNPFITGTAASQVWGLAVADPPSNISAPSISGPAVQGQTLSETHGTWTGANSPTTFSIQWLLCNSAGISCVPIPGATAGTFQPTFADAGSTIRVQETATNLSGGPGGTAISAQTAVVTGLPPANTAAPTISGTGVSGQTLTEAHGTWTNSPTGFSYQWELCDTSGANCQAIAGATAQTFAITAADAGKTLRVTEAASNAYGTSSPTASAATAVAALAQPKVAKVSIEGASASVVVDCNGAAGQTCAGRYTITTHESLQGNSVVAVNASKHKAKPKKKRVTVGQGSYSLASGTHKTLHLSLNGTGKRLLTQFYSVPVTVTLAGPSPTTTKLTFSYPVIRSPIAFTWAFSTQSTVAQQLMISKIPAKGTVTVSCSGGGCPFSKRSFTPHGGTVDLAPSFKHGLKPHATVEVEISAANKVAKVATFTIQSGAQPTLTELCQPPGANKPTRCVHS